MPSDNYLLNQILEKIERLEQCQLDNERKLELILKNTSRMEDHINFVEKTYENVKTPFHYLMEKVNILSFLSFRKTELNNTNINNKIKDEDNNSNIAKSESDSSGTDVD